jgi:ADP-heptose:LPS heptosyltransferase
VHASRAVKTPSVIVYGGASHPDFCGYTENVNVVSACPCKCDLTKRSGVSCTKQFICLTTITTENVLDAIEKLEKDINETK